MLSLLLLLSLPATSARVEFNVRSSPVPAHPPFRRSPVPGATFVTSLPSPRLHHLLRQRGLATRSPAQHPSARSCRIPKMLFGAGTVAEQGKQQQEKAFRDYQLRVSRVNSLEDVIEELTDEQLAAKTEEFRARLRAGETEDDILEEAFAVVREAAWRTLQLRHYDVQLMGGMALNDGKLAEMATGEGKTLVSTCPCYLNALSKGGVHIVTVNDYLARRDFEQMSQVYRFLGITVGLVQADAPTAAKREAYDSDITYVTNSELGFDHLRDNLAVTPDDVVILRDFNFCVVDEADSILVDEARTPLIISTRVSAPVNKYAGAKKLADFLVKGQHYSVSEKDQSVLLTDEGQRAGEQILAIDDMYSLKTPWANYVLNALKAKELFELSKNYIVKDDEIVIVDEFTGRPMPGRRWSDGLHQSMEAKENIKVGDETEVSAQISYQSFFRLYKTLSGMTGTANSNAVELVDIYQLDIMNIPTALPVARRDYPDYIFKNVRGKSRALLKELKLMHATRRPILVGTGSVESSELLAKKLTQDGIKHQVLNAKAENMQREAETIAQAGRLDCITIATNLAGRGTDITLGGNALAMAKLLVRERVASVLGVDVPPVALESYPATLTPAAEDSITAATTALQQQTAGAALTLEALDEMLAVASSVTPLQESQLGEAALRAAVEAVEEEFEGPVKEEAEKVVSLGGLHVIGSQRYESARVDLQLRGRSGRQGDPGSSRFFISLEDEMFRVFGGDKMQKLMDTFRVSDDLPIESKQVAESLDKMQQQVEDYFSGIRTALFEYDQVMSDQRAAHYAQRKRILLGDGAVVHEAMLQSCESTVEEILQANMAEPEAVKAKLEAFFPGVSLEAVTIASDSAQQAQTDVMAAIEKGLKEKEQALEAVKAGLAEQTQSYLLLVQNDNAWQQHLKEMENLKQFVGLRSYGADNPLQAFQSEGFKFFTQMQKSVMRNTVFSFFSYQPTQAS